jgi:hypothetical protein
MNTLKELRVPLIIFVVFWGIAFVLWQTSGKAFYLLNFGYIGTAVGFGIGLYVLLPRKSKPSGRRFAQLLVGIDMVGFLGQLRKKTCSWKVSFSICLQGFLRVL